MADEAKTNADQTRAAKSDSPQVDIPSAKSVIRETAAALPVLRSAVEANTADIERIKAQTDSSMRQASLTFSFCVFTMLFGSHVYFFAIGKIFTLPYPMDYIIWCMIIGPWAGTGLPRFINLLSEKLGEKK